MPCYQVQTASVNLDKADLSLLKKALEKEGYTVVVSGKTLRFTRGSETGTYANNKISITSTDNSKKIDTDSIKRSYSDKVIHHMAERYEQEGWELTQDGDEYIWNRSSSGYGANYA